MIGKASHGSTPMSSPSEKKETNANVQEEKKIFLEEDESNHPR